MKVRLADNILAEPVQKSYTQALSEVQPSIPMRSNNPIILEPSITTWIKLTNAEVNTVRQKIETALKGNEIKINAISIRPTHAGKIVVGVENNANKQIAITQLNQVAAP